LRKKYKFFLISKIKFNIAKHLNKTPMKKAVKVIGKIIYTVLALSPIFALGYMLGLKLL
jgi:hypothetical protein